MMSPVPEKRYECCRQYLRNDVNDVALNEGQAGLLAGDVLVLVGVVVEQGLQPNPV